MLLAIAAGFGFCSSSSSSELSSDLLSDNEFNESLQEDAKVSRHWITSPRFPEKVDFAGEPVPVHFFDIRESLERELIVNMNFHSNTLQCLKRITRFFPVIEPILAANDIPDDFKYLSLIESDYMNKVSPSGATGFWQFMKAAGAECGLEISAEVDERYHLEKSTVAACRYLNEAYKVFGNWTMAAASYNMGKGGLSNQVKRQQCNFYYDLLLSEETMRYIFRIIAVKLIMSNPQEYGFDVPEKERYLPIPYNEVEVKTGVPNLVEFAFRHQTNYKMLKYLNPWLRDNKLTNASRKAYLIKIPAENFRGNIDHRIDEKEVEKIEQASEESKLDVK